MDVHFSANEQDILYISNELSGDLWSLFLKIYPIFLGDSSNIVQDSTNAVCCIFYVWRKTKFLLFVSSRWLLMVIILFYLVFMFVDCFNDIFFVVFCCKVSIK